jgi:predicted nucleic acid-binding protein
MVHLLLADTSVWIDHLRRGDADLSQALNDGRVLGHPMVTGEIAMGSLRDRAEILDALQRLPQAIRATDEEVIDLVNRQRLFSQGLGFVDAHLLASALLTPEAILWTRDARLREVAVEVGIGT